VGKITAEQVRKIAEQKMVDLNAASIETAESMIKDRHSLTGNSLEPYLFSRKC
jgi:large subunit ribosomal protein L11